MAGEPPPAGWYHDGRALRWWDGRVWGPYAPYPPPQASGTNSITWATLVHFGFAAGGLIGPLVLRLTEGRTDDFVRHHSTEALNGNLTILLAYLGAYLPGFASSVAVGASWPLFVGLGVTVLVTGVMVTQMIFGGVRASQGRWFRYPLTIRFVRGGMARGEIRPMVQRHAAPTPRHADVPARLPAPVRALREGAADMRRRPRAWAGVGSGTLALTLAPYFVAVAVNDLVFRYDLWNDVPPSPTADWVAVASLIASGIAGFAGLTLGWGWMAALATDPAAGARTSLRRSAGASLRRVWYAAPAMALAALACATVVGAPIAVGLLAPAAFPLMSLRPSRPGWFGRVLGHAFVIGLFIAAAALIVYASWAVGAIVDANALGAVAIFAACALEVTVAVALVASTLGVLHQADTTLGSGRPSNDAWPAP